MSPLLCQNVEDIAPHRILLNAVALTAAAARGYLGVFGEIFGHLGKPENGSEPPIFRIVSAFTREPTPFCENVKNGRFSCRIPLLRGGGRGIRRPRPFSTISGFFYFLKKSNSFHTSDKRVRKRDQKTHGIRFTENKKHNFSTKPTKRGVKAPAFQREHLAARFSGFEASYPLIPLCEKDARPPEATKLAAYTSATP
jgi:hypothetical protein